MSATTPLTNVPLLRSINAPASGAGSFASFQAAAIATNGTLPGVPSPNLVGIGASASVVPGPFSGSESGVALPTGPSASAASESSVSYPTTTPGASAGVPGPKSTATPGTGTDSGNSAPSPTTSPSGAGLTSANIVVAIGAALFGIVLSA